MKDFNLKTELSETPNSLTVSIGFPINVDRNDENTNQKISDIIFQYQSKYGKQGWLLQEYGNVERLSDDGSYIFREFVFKKEAN